MAPSSLRALSSSDECSSDGSSSSSEESEFLPQAEDAATDNSSSAVSSPLEESSDPLDPESADFPMKVAEFWKNQMEEQNRLFYEGVRDAMLGLPQRTLPTLAFPPASEPQAADSAEAALASSFLFNLFSASKRPFFESSSASAATGALPSTDFPELTTSKEGAASLASLAPDVFSVFAPDFAAFLQRNPFAIPALECSSQEEQWCQWMAEQHRYFQEAQMEMAERRDSQAGARQLEFSSEGDEARPRESSVDASEKSEDSRERWRRQVRELRGAMQESVSGDFVPCIRGGFRFSRQSRRRNGASSRRRKSGKKYVQKGAKPHVGLSLRNSLFPPRNSLSHCGVCAALLHRTRLCLHEARKSLEVKLKRCLVEAEGEEDEHRQLPFVAEAVFQEFLQQSELWAWVEVLPYFSEALIRKCLRGTGLFQKIQTSVTISPRTHERSIASSANPSPVWKLRSAQRSNLRFQESGPVSRKCRLGCMTNRMLCV